MLSQAVKGVSNLLLFHTNWTVRSLWHARAVTLCGALKTFPGWPALLLHTLYDL